ncbi:MAG: anti-sigma factor [Chloroflexota bacterium]
MSGVGETRYGGRTCSEITEMAALYVLGALTPEDREQVETHLADCPEAHAEIEELGGVVPALAASAELRGAPAALKSRVMAAYREEKAGASAPVVREVPRAVVAPLSAPMIAPREFRRPWLAWAGALAAVLLIAVVGGFALTVQQRADREAQRSEQIAAAIDIMAQPLSTVAFLSGTGPATGARGFAAFAGDGNGFLVMVGLPDAPAGQTYQAWYLTAGQATSAGLLTVDADGYAVLEGGLAGLGSVDLVALTIERAGGVAQPTSDPVAVGELRSNLTSTAAPVSLRAWPASS